MSEANVVHFPKRIQPPKFKLPAGLSAAPNDTLAQGSRGELVASLQQWLYKRGFDPGEADGIYGPRTAAAVGGLQQLLNGVNGIMLTRSGQFDAATRTAVQTDLANKSGVLRTREDDYLTQPPQKVTWGKVMSSGNEIPSEVMPADTTRTWLGIGLGAAALGLLGWMFLSDKKKGNAAIAGEDLFDSDSDSDDFNLGDDRTEDDDTEAEEDTATLTERSADFLRRAAEAMTDRQAKRETLKQADWLAKRAEALRRGEPSPPNNPFLGLGNKYDKKPGGPTDKEVIRAAKEVGMTAKKDSETGEWRIHAKGDRDPEHGYFTDDNQDAINSARMMSKELKDMTDKEVMGPQTPSKKTLLNDAPTSSPKGKMQACASQWRALGPDKGGTEYRPFMSDCMKSFA